MYVYTSKILEKSSKTAYGFIELLPFLRNHPFKKCPVEAFMLDCVTATKFYIAKVTETHLILFDGKDIYSVSKQYKHIFSKVYTSTS